MSKTFLLAAKNLEWVESEQLSLQEACEREPFMLFQHHTGDPGVITQEEIDALINGGNVDKKKRYYCWNAAQQCYEELEDAGEGIYPVNDAFRLEAYCCLLEARPYTSYKLLPRDFIDTQAQRADLPQLLREYIEKAGESKKALELADECFSVREFTQAPIIWEIEKQEACRVRISTVCQNIRTYQAEENAAGMQKIHFGGIYLYRTGYDLFFDMRSGQVKVKITEWHHREKPFSVNCREENGFPKIFEKMPAQVLALAMQYAEENAELIFGFKPLCNYTALNASVLKGFIKRPLDYRVCELESFLGEAFEKIVPRDENNCFAACCKALKIPRTPFLRKLYLKNPVYIIRFLVLKELGFEDLNIIWRMLDLAGALFYPSPLRAKFSGQTVSTEVVGNERGKRYYLHLKNYMRLQAEKRGIGMACRHLIKAVRLKTGERPDAWFDSFEMIYEYWDKIPEALQKRALDEGPSPAVHDALSLCVAEISHRGHGGHLSGVH